MLMLTKILSSIPVVVFGFLLVVSPLLARVIPGENGFRLFLPAAAGVVALLIVICYRHVRLHVLRAPALICIGIFMLFAVASVSWSINPDFAMFRWTHQVILLLTVVLPFVLVSRSLDLIATLHVICLIAMITNAFFVLTVPPSPVGHPGYFWHKQYLGMYASVTLILAVHELSGKWWQKTLAVISMVLATWLLFASQSKLSLGFVLMAPAWAGIAVFLAYRFRWSLSLLLAIPVLAFAGASALISNLPYRISWWLTGDPTFTGRSYIWQIIEQHADLKPWFGWGYQSYWLVPNSPILQEQSFVRDMLSSHNGYLDVRVQVGYVGLFLFVLFLISVFRQLDFLVRMDPLRSWLFAALGSFIIMVNYLDTTWLIAYDANWVLFIMIAAEGARLMNVRQEERMHSHSRPRLVRRKGSKVWVYARA